MGILSRFLEAIGWKKKAESPKHEEQQVEQPITKEGRGWEEPVHDSGPVTGSVGDAIGSGVIIPPAEIVVPVKIPKDVLPTPVEEPKGEPKVEVPAIEPAPVECPVISQPIEPAPIEKDPVHNVEVAPVIEPPINEPVRTPAPVEEVKPSVPTNVLASLPEEKPLESDVPTGGVKVLFKSANDLPPELKPYYKQILALPWMEQAVNELLQHVTEVPGPANNPRIIWYHSFCTLKAKADSVPWCAAFVNAMLISTGWKGTAEAWARSFLQFGKKLAKPKFGCVVVMSRGNSKINGHVCFYIKTLSNGKILCLGGNQDDKVCLKVYDADRVLGYRWPEQKVK